MVQRSLSLIPSNIHGNDDLGFIALISTTIILPKYLLVYSVIITRHLTQSLLYVPSFIAFRALAELPLAKNWLRVTASRASQANCSLPWATAYPQIEQIDKRSTGLDLSPPISIADSTSPFLNHLSSTTYASHCDSTNLLILHLQCGIELQRATSHTTALGLPLQYMQKCRIARAHAQTRAAFVTVPSHPSAHSRPTTSSLGSTALASEPGIVSSRSKARCCRD